MSIISKLSMSTRYLLAIPGLLVGGFLGLAIALTGEAEAGGFVVLFFGGGLAGAAGGYVLGRRRDVRTWVSTGRELGLIPKTDGGGLLPEVPDLTGTVDGRRVRVSMETASRERGRIAYTHVEVGLDSPAEEGVEIRRTDAAGGRQSPVFGDASGEVELAGATVQRDPLVATGPSEDVARALVSGRARETLLEAGMFGVQVGDTSYVYDDHRAQLDDVPTGSLAESMLEGFGLLGGGDPTKVTNEGTVELLADPDELERHVRALVAVADAFEEARDRTRQYA